MFGVYIFTKFESHLIVIALLHQKLLPAVRMVQLLRVAGDQGVEESIEATIPSAEGRWEEMQTRQWHLYLRGLKLTPFKHTGSSETCSRLWSRFDL